MSVCDQEYGLSVGRGSFNFTPGAWTRVRQTVALNTPGMQDGAFALEVNGQEVMRRADVFYRDVPSAAPADGSDGDGLGEDEPDNAGDDEDGGSDDNDDSGGDSSDNGGPTGESSPAPAPAPPAQQAPTQDAGLLGSIPVVGPIISPIVGPVIAPIVGPVLNGLRFRSL